MPNASFEFVSDFEIRISCSPRQRALLRYIQAPDCPFAAAVGAEIEAAAVGVPDRVVVPASVRRDLRLLLWLRHIKTMTGEVEPSTEALIEASERTPPGSVDVSGPKSDETSIDVSPP